MLASAPNPASRPDQIKRFTSGLSVIVRDSIRVGGSEPVACRARRRRLHASYPSSPWQIVSTINVFARSSSSSPTAALSKIHPVSTCSMQP